MGEFGRGNIGEPEDTKGGGEGQSKGGGEGGPAPADLIKLEKEKQKSFKAASAAGGPMAMLLSILQDIGLIQPLLDFVSILTDAIGAGLGDTIQQLSEALFTPDNIALMQMLGEIIAEVVELGLVPVMALLKDIMPLLIEVMPYLSIILGYIKDGTEALKVIMAWIGDMIGLLY